MHEQLIDLLSSEDFAEESENNRIRGVLVGKFKGFTVNNSPLVDFFQNREATSCTARTTVALSAEDTGREVVLVFENGDPKKPIITGLLQQTESPKENGNGKTVPQQKVIEAKVDGERITFIAENEIILRCGKASITLTRAGKIHLRGTYILNRSSGVNRIKGGSVQIN